jgi:hypothetical protein
LREETQISDHRRAHRVVLFALSEAQFQKLGL